MVAGRGIGLEGGSELEPFPGNLRVGPGLPVPPVPPSRGTISIFHVVARLHRGGWCLQRGSPHRGLGDGDSDLESPPQRPVPLLLPRSCSSLWAGQALLGSPSHPSAASWVQAVTARAKKQEVRGGGRPQELGLLSPSSREWETAWAGARDPPAEPPWGVGLPPAWVGGLKLASAYALVSGLGAHEALA